MQNRTEAMADPLYRSFNGGDVKGASCTHRNLAHIRPNLDSTRDHRTHDIACLEALDAPCLFWTSARKTVAIHTAHLTIWVSSCFDQQRDDATRIKHDWRTFPNTGCIEPVSFFKCSRDTIEFGDATAATFNGQAQRFQTRKEFPPRRVDRRRIF